MQAKTDKIELGLIILTGISSVFHFQAERLGTQVMLFLGASLVLYYVMRGTLFFRAWPRARGFALAGFGLFAYCAFIVIFILSLFLNIPGLENRLPLLLYTAPVPAVCLGYLIARHERSDWRPFASRIIIGLLILFLSRFLLS